MNDGSDESASEWIRQALQRYERPLVRYAAGITCDPERARDVVQETFLKLCREPRSKVEPYLAEWLFRVCRNRALDVLRKENRVEPLEAEDLERCATGELSPAGELERRETTGQILGLIQQLPKNQREVVRLKLQEGFRYEEISRITGLSVSNVGFLLHTALKTVRRKLNTLHCYENRA